MNSGYENRKNYCSCQNEFEEFGRIESLFKKICCQIRYGPSNSKRLSKIMKKFKIFCCHIRTVSKCFYVLIPLKGNQTETHSKCRMGMVLAPLLLLQSMDPHAEGKAIASHALEGW